MGGLRSLTLLAGCAVALAACDMPVEPVPVPPERPTTPVPEPEEPVALPTGPSEKSQRLAAYYTKVETQLVAQGLLRTDGGGPDTQFSRRMLLENFERIAFYDEYARGGGLTASRGAQSRLKRWEQPVRMSVEFGSTVTEAQKATDRAGVSRYAARLARVSGHSITMSSSDPNYHVLFMSEDDADTLPARIKAIVPNINQNALGHRGDPHRTSLALAQVLRPRGTSPGPGSRQRQPQGAAVDLQRR